ncbi:hypothetical protein [Arthrobacter sp. ISL-28]|uniref:hypothetical protein n=1 Tax=Arthrobacter sp. ISL-28 TaxID=2819108 RepID=UPI001BEB1B94|nr:hypothetical protein [Arthrobacter sp. ISL-28]MBT2519505.1 hypothetical protein [Arthrobacter sp. ISL-28]
MTYLIDRIDIQVTSRPALDQQLDDAVRTLQELAMQSGTHGILITRLAPGHYTAALSDQVPFGTTRELNR